MPAAAACFTRGGARAQCCLWPHPGLRPPSCWEGFPGAAPQLPTRGWQRRAWGLSPEAWAPQDTQNLRVPRRRGFLAPLSPRLGFLKPKFWPLWLSTLPGFQEAVPALRSDESALRSAIDRQTEGGWRRTKGDEQLCPPWDVFLKSEPLTLVAELFLPPHPPQIRAPQKPFQSIPALSLEVDWSWSITQYAHPENTPEPPSVPGADLEVLPDI